MGVMSLNGIQLTDRLILLLMPPKYHPDYNYVRKVCFWVDSLLQVTLTSQMTSPVLCHITWLFPVSRQVRTLRMHLFTVVQLVCLALLWVVMASAAALAFPFMLLLTIPVRMLILPRLFTRRELLSVSATHQSIIDQCSQFILLLATAADPTSTTAATSSATAISTSTTAPTLTTTIATAAIIT